MDKLNFTNKTLSKNTSLSQSYINLSFLKQLKNQSFNSSTFVEIDPISKKKKKSDFRRDLSQQPLKPLDDYSKDIKNIMNDYKVDNDGKPVNFEHDLKEDYFKNPRKFFLKFNKYLDATKLDRSTGK